MEDQGRTTFNQALAEKLAHLTSYMAGHGKLRTIKKKSLIKKIFSFVLLPLLLVSYNAFHSKLSSARVEPPSWWIGLKNSELQLLVYGKNIATTTVTVDYPGFILKKVHKTDNPNYLFLDLTINHGTKPGIATIRFKTKDKEVAKYPV